MKAAIKEWLKDRGENFIKSIGIKKGQTALDFGCGRGHYTIPAARVIGNNGKVYALEKDKRPLAELRRIAKTKGLKNIKVVKTAGRASIALITESMDAVLLYDVLHPHYFDNKKRRKLLNEVYRVAKTNALISVYPKHMELDDVIKQMRKAKFHLAKKSFKKLVHDESFDKGYVLSFRK